MTFSDGIWHNIVAVDPAAQAMFRNAFLELNRRFFPGNEKRLCQEWRLFHRNLRSLESWRIK
jgi:hypothetical protein